MKAYISIFAKGAAMGAANVIPGVSGGTIALITGIYRRLLEALGNCDLTALRLLLNRQFSSFARRIDAAFLASIGAGILFSILTLAKLMKYLLAHHEAPTMAFFFGLILASVYYLCRDIDSWKATRVLSALIGCSAAVGISLIAPSNPNTHFLYLFACGVIAICSMVLPGLSGSYVLVLMGNYALVIESISELNLKILLPVALGCCVGLLAFTHFLTWIYKRFEQATIALMCGFVIGSLLVIWPWKTAKTELIADKVKTVGYDWQLPMFDNSNDLGLLLFMLAGIFALIFIERSAKQNQPS